MQLCPFDLMGRGEVGSSFLPSVVFSSGARSKSLREEGGGQGEPAAHSQPPAELRRLGCIYPASSLPLGS